MNTKDEIYEKKFYSYGTSKIFEQRQKTYHTRLKAISFLGFVSPLILGGYVASFSTESETLRSILLPICGILTISQLLLSLASIIYKWDDIYAYSISASKDNLRLANEFAALEKSSQDHSEETPLTIQLNQQYNIQEASDNAQMISGKERRFAMRSALYLYRKKCPICKITPNSMKPENCDTCGNF